jgi:sporulation protein YlmC with PRC-barrel domain
MENRAVIRATELNGRSVVDLDSAEEVGRIDRIVLDPDTRQVAGFLVSRGAALTGGRTQMTVPASSVRAIGPDAITIHRARTVDAGSIERLETLPKASDVIGRKVVSEDGRLLGKVDDVLIHRADGRIIGYTLGEVLNRLEGLFRRDKKDHEPYLRADAELRMGKELIVAPVGAMTEELRRDEGHLAEVVSRASEPERRGIEPGAPLAPRTSIRRAD